MNILNLLTLITAITGFIISGILIFSAQYNRFVNRFLGISFFTISYRSISIYLLNEGFIDDTFAMGTVCFMFYLIAPVFYLYIRTVIKDEQSLRKKDMLHFVLPGLATALLLFYVIAGYVKKGRLVLPLQENLFNNDIEHGWQVQFGYHVIIIFCMVVFYLGITWKLILQKLNKGNTEQPQHQKIRRWIYTLIIPCTLLVALFVFTIILRIFFKINISDGLTHGLEITRPIILLYIFSRVIFNSDLLLGLPDIKTTLPVIDRDIQLAAIEPMPVVERETTVSAQITGAELISYDSFGWVQLSHPAGTGKTISTSGTIETDKAVLYIQKINDYLNSEPFTDPEFSMSSMSAALLIPVYQLEYLFRYYNKYSFSAFRNRARVQYVLSCFRNGLGQHYTLEAIGEKAGFSSRTSFFRVFKMVTGKSPKQLLGTLDKLADTEKN